MRSEIYGICSMTSAWPSYAHHWEALRKQLRPSELHVIFDETQGARRSDPSCDLFPNYFAFTHAQVRANLNFPHEPSKQHYWNHHGNRNAVWFYAALRMMNFYLAHPNHDFYTFFDDDVSCKDWPGYIEGLEDVNHDFLAYYLFKNLGVTSQPDVPNVGPGMYSFQGPDCNWFGRFPGHGDTLPPFVDKFGSFYAVVRYSNAAMKHLVELNSQGFFGYSEGFVPTVLNAAGFSMASLFGSDDKSPFLDPSVELVHKNTKVTWSWL